MIIFISPHSGSTINGLFVAALMGNLNT